MSYRPTTLSAMSATLRGLHGGPFLVQEARATGVADFACRRFVVTGEWTRLRRGICVESALLECGDPARVHAVHVAAGLLALAPAHVVGSHESAAVLHGIALLGPTPAEVTLTRPPGGGHRHRLRGARIHLASIPV